MIPPPPDFSTRMPHSDVATMDWKETLAELLRQDSHVTSEEQAKGLEILYHPKTAGVWEEMDGGLCKLLLSECTYTFFMPQGEPPVLWRDRDKLKRQAKAARNLHDKVKDPVEDVVRVPTNLP